MEAAVEFAAVEAGLACSDRAIRAVGVQLRVA